jgi:pre-mRNA-splicing factor 38A
MIFRQSDPIIRLILQSTNREGTFILTHVDEFVEELLSEERALDVILPRIQKRTVLEVHTTLVTKNATLLRKLLLRSSL